jgi:hypothetical protein
MELVVLKADDTLAVEVQSCKEKKTLDIAIPNEHCTEHTHNLGPHGEAYSARRQV